MIDHHTQCTGMPCTCKTSKWDDTWGAANPSIGIPPKCTCIHISGIWLTRGHEVCRVHPCDACTMRAGHHTAHVHIEGLSNMADDVHVRTCWACGAQQYMNRFNLWVHVYPAKGCEVEGVQASHRPTAHTINEGETE